MYSQFSIDLVGWIYFFAWSLSFYGQLLLNYKLKNVEGMNFDFLAMNVTGFSFYSLYCSYGYFFPQGAASTGKVDLNDLLFAYHAIFITLLTVIQAFMYQRGKNKIMRATIIYLSILWAFAIVYGILTLVLKVMDVPPRLSVLSFMGYFKLSISFLKYLPQMYWNFVRKSTKGWSICNILLDFTGGAFSFLQMGMEYSNGKDLNINPVKLALSIICMVYDLIFIFQHYVLYPPKGQSVEQGSPKGTEIEDNIVSDRVKLSTANDKLTTQHEDIQQKQPILLPPV